jgi:hypothetical protein
MPILKEYFEKTIRMSNFMVLLSFGDSCLCNQSSFAPAAATPERKIVQRDDEMRIVQDAPRVENCFEVVLFENSLGVSNPRLTSSQGERSRKVPKPYL